MNVERLRLDFPILQLHDPKQKVVYFDNAATSLKPLAVVDAMRDYYVYYPANPGRGEYDLAYRASQAVDAARDNVANLLSTTPDTIVFTSGTTMGINLVADAFVRKHLTAGDEILITEAEHAANVLPWYQLQERYGLKVTIIELDDEQKLTCDLLEKNATPRSKFLAFSDVSNVLGTKTDTTSIVKWAHDHGMYVLVDAAQSVPHFETNVIQLDVDFLVFSGHKLCGPTGIGVLYAKRAHLDRMDPYTMGGGMSLKYAKDFSIRFAPVPEKFEAGTQPIAEIIGLSAAINYVRAIGFDAIHAHEMALRRYAIQALKKIPFVKLYNEHADTGIITFNLDGVFPQDAATHYNAHGIAIRSGQHCARNLVHYLGTDGTLRWSCYFYNTFEEVDAFIEATKQGKEFLDAFFK
jgi:cysteine desulfurase / selenocysteine lyase